MSKFAMLNCWDDLNKGDLGIMLGTVRQFQREDPEANIIGISSFNSSDKAFTQGHVLLRRYVPEVFPAIFGTIGLNVFGKYRKDPISKIVVLFAENIRYLLCMYTPNSLAWRFLTKNEQKTLKELMSCELAFSKGGSVFTDYNTLRGAIALVRVCRFYKLLKKFGVKYYILGQSFGPIKSNIGVSSANLVIDNAEHVFIREYECISKYPELHLHNNNVSFSNDAGFLLDPIEVSPNPIHHDRMNVGLTIRGEKNDEAYRLAMAEMITYLVKTRNCYVHIFRQVAMDSEPDNLATEDILKRLDLNIQSGVFYHKENYLPQELCWLYGEMDYFIGTRLHSTIFSMRAGTPAVGIVYHGTKTQGIYQNIGVPELVISGNLTTDLLIQKFEYMVSNRKALEETIHQGVIEARKEMSNAIKIIVNRAKS